MAATVQVIGRYEVKWEDKKCFARLKGNEEWHEVKEGQSLEQIGAVHGNTGKD